jgi:catechol 2,3-dioxygenase-like lactoylglutathione lyase family enzyme
MSISIEPGTVIPLHLSLNVADLERSVEFFSRLFDIQPAKRRADYVKFELANPPLVLSLEASAASVGAPLNHVGIRLQNSEQLVELQKRLEFAGFACKREDGVECCYSRQTKFWITDPDRNLWEVYTLEVDLDHRGVGQLPLVERPSEKPRQPPAPSVWVHRLGDPISDRLLIESDGVDQVLLQGSFNQQLAPEKRRQLLDEVRRILKPGGQLTVHGLSADRPIVDVRGRLPGPAAVVECIPSTSELIAELERAGFEEIRFAKFNDSACLAIDSIALRETQVVAFRRCKPSVSSCHAVLYKGPFRQLEDDRGRIFARGQWVSIDDDESERLRASPIGEQFSFRAD